MPYKITITSLADQLETEVNHDCDPETEARKLLFEYARDRPLERDPADISISANWDFSSDSDRVIESGFVTTLVEADFSRLIRSAMPDLRACGLLHHKWYPPSCLPTGFQYLCEECGLVMTMRLYGTQRELGQNDTISFSECRFESIIQDLASL